MVQFIGNSIPIQQTGTTQPTYDVSSLLGSLAKPFLDSGTTQLKQSVFDKNNAETQKLIDAKARVDAAVAGVGDLDNPNFNALKAAAVAGDVDAQKGLGNLLLLYHANKDGAGAQSTQNAQVGAGQSFGNTAASDNARNATTRYGVDAAERTKMAIDANAPATILVPNEDDPNAPPVPTIARRADSYGKPASVQIGEQQGALATKVYPNLLNDKTAENVPDAALKAVNAQPSRDNVYNYIVKNDDGTITQGRSLDGGKTDAVSNKPLPANAQLLSPSNAGGAGSMLPPGGLDQSQANKLIPQRDALRQVIGLSQTLRGMAEKSPELVGPTGNMIRGTQDVVDLGNSISSTFGDPKQFQDAYAKAVQDMQARGVKVPAIMTNDPRASAMVKLNTILTYQAASALAGQQGRSMSDQDFDAAQKMVGTPDSWMHGPTNYINGLKTIEDYATGQMNTIDQQLKARNIAPAGVTPQPSAPAAPAQADPRAAVPGARQAPDGNYYVPDPARPGKYLMVQ